jgi:hypothetical protein
MTSATALDRVIPAPRLVEVDHVDLAVSPRRAWDEVRHGDLGDAPLARALFLVRTLPDRLAQRGSGAKLQLRVDALHSSPESPGFQILADDGRSEVVIGAIGKVWHLQIPFVHVDGAEAFRAFSEPRFVKVAWALRVTPRGEHDSRVTLELRVDATDAESWARFGRYFAVIGPGSRFVRRALFAALAERLGAPGTKEQERPLAGDELLPDARAQLTHGITIEARPAAIWPWLVQMGCGRAGFYSIDALDNGGARSAREIHPEWQRVRVGDILRATPDGEDGFEVLAIEPERSLVLGGLYDADGHQQREFSAERPERFWHATWSFVLEPLDAATTRLHVRARAAFPETDRLRVEWIRPVHHLMETAQLEHLAARVEDRLPRDDWHDVLAGLGGAAIMAAAFLTPFQRGARSHWGLDEATASRRYPGDELVAAPRWGWTHGIEIDAAAEEVWPWVAQLGADRGGFYSYQWLENVAGCGVRNAETIHDDWTIREGGLLRLHPEMPPLHVAALERGRYFVALAAADEAARAAGEPWAEASWLFFLEPLGPTRCRLVSRYRCATSDQVAMRLTMGPTFLEPVGFAMDRRMLLGLKSRAEDTATNKPLRNVVRRRPASAN